MLPGGLYREPALGEENSHWYLPGASKGRPMLRSCMDCQTTIRENRCTHVFTPDPVAVEFRNRPGPVTQEMVTSTVGGEGSHVSANGPASVRPG